MENSETIIFISLRIKQSYKFIVTYNVVYNEKSTAENKTAIRILIKDCGNCMKFLLKA